MKIREEGGVRKTQEEEESKNKFSALWREKGAPLKVQVCKQQSGIQKTTALKSTHLILQNFSLGQLPYEFTDSLDWEEGLDDATEVSGKIILNIGDMIWVGSFRLAIVFLFTFFLEKKGISSKTIFYNKKKSWKKS